MKSFNKVILIPARSGSKRIKNKNIKLFAGKPLLAHSIIQAKKIKNIDHIIVSTDSKKYANIAESYGAKCYYLRPKNISKNFSTDLDVFKFNEFWLNQNLNYKTDIYIHLRPTYPNRNLKDINEMIKIFEKNYDNIHSLRSVVKFEKKLEKIYQIDKNNFLKSSFGFKRFESQSAKDYMCNQADQILPKYFIHDGAIDIFKSNILKKNTISGNKIMAYITKSDGIDINNLDDFKKSIKSKRK